MATTYQVTAGLDDCYRVIDSDYWDTSEVSFSVGYYNATHPNAGAAARFLGLNIPAGSTINSAVLRLTAYVSLATTTVNTRLRCEKTGTPATFSTSANFDGRTWTTAKVNWDAVPAWIQDTEYDSPDIKACVQEIIDGVGAITDLVVLWDDFEKRSTQANGTRRLGTAYEESTTKAPQLVITYTPPVAGRSQGYIIG